MLIDFQNKIGTHTCFWVYWIVHLAKVSMDDEHVPNKNQRQAKSFRHILYMHICKLSKYMIGSISTPHNGNVTFHEQDVCSHNYEESSNVLQIFGLLSGVHLAGRS